MSAAAIVIPAMVLASVLLVLGPVVLAVVITRRAGASDRWFSRGGGAAGRSCESWGTARRSYDSP